MAFTLASAVLLVFACATGVYAESHTVKFDNRCGYGTPQLIEGGDVLTTTSYTSTGELVAVIANQTRSGSCGFNGERCTLLEMTLTNPEAVGGGSSADISLIDPHTFSVVTHIEFYDGCDGVSTTCNSANCNTAFKQPDDTWVSTSGVPRKQRAFASDVAASCFY
ncbi:glycopeptide [Mycena sp. CBHHK59/15]|nr:glycopeptide [Mycena sp. CBHHK59/15]